MSVSLKMPFGVFGIIGLAAAPRILKARRGRAQDVLEEASLAYKEMNDRLDPEGRFYATYVNQVEDLLHEFCRLRKDDELARMITEGFSKFRQKYSIPTEDSPERRNEMRRLFDSIVPPESRHASLLERLPTLRRLWSLHEELLESQAPDSRGDPLLDVGLGLLLLCRRHCFCTPLNAETFADTMGDGTHFSLLQVGNTLTDDAPVVMTCPANLGESLVLGGNLREFLALGIDCGYFHLEQLSYRGIDTCDVRDGAGQNESQRQTLRRIVEEFELRPWKDPVERLQELQAKYAPAFRLPVDLFD